MSGHTMAAGNVPAVLAAPLTTYLVFRVAIRELVRRRTLVFLGFLCLLPIAITLFWRTWGTDAVEADQFFTNLVALLYLKVLVYVVGLSFGIPTINSEVQGRTLTYLLTRPVNKIFVYAGRLLAVQLTAGGLLAASLVGCFAIIVAGNFDTVSVEFLKTYLNHVLIVLLATVCVTAVGGIFGTALRRPELFAIGFVFVWDIPVSTFVGKLKAWTLQFHFNNLLLSDDNVQEILLDAFRALLSDDFAVAGWVSAVVLVFVLVGSMLLGGWIFSRKEYVIS